MKFFLVVLLYLSKNKLFVPWTIEQISKQGNGEKTIINWMGNEHCALARIVGACGSVKQTKNPYDK